MRNERVVVPKYISKQVFIDMIRKGAVPASGNIPYKVYDPSDVRLEFHEEHEVVFNVLEPEEIEKIITEEILTNHLKRFLDSV